MEESPQRDKGKTVMSYLTGWGRCVSQQRTRATLPRNFLPPETMESRRERAGDKLPILEARHRDGTAGGGGEENFIRRMEICERQSALVARNPVSLGDFANDFTADAGKAAGVERWREDRAIFHQK